MPQKKSFGYRIDPDIHAKAQKVMAMSGEITLSELHAKVETAIANEVDLDALRIRLEF